jgi:hypothetical protein
VDDRVTRLLKSAVTALVAVTAVLFLAHAPHARAFDARFHRQPKALSPDLTSALTEKVSDEATLYLDKEDEKHRDGQTYVDLQPKFEYLPNYGPHGEVVVSVKLGGAEYQPVKGESGKGKATGRLKYLVFTYGLDKKKHWVEMSKPKWEVQNLGRAAAKKMTAAAERAEKRKAAIAERRQKALEQAAQKAQQRIDKGVKPEPGSVPPQSGSDVP